MPVGAPTFAEALRAGAEIFQTLKSQLKSAGLNTNVGDEGGFAPNLKSAEAALDFVMQAITKAGYKPGGDVMLALDCAATEFFKDGAYVYEARARNARRRSRSIIWRIWSANIRSSPIEDAMSEDDWAGWKLLTQKVGAKCQLSATICSSPRDAALERHRRRHRQSILVKVNQIGTLTETLAAVEMAHKAAIPQ